MPRRTGSDFTFRDYLYIGGIILSMGTQLAQVNSLRNELTTLQSRYDREVVPRQEHMQMNAVLEQRLQGISERQVEGQKQLNQVEMKVDKVLMGQQQQGMNRK